MPPLIIVTIPLFFMLALVVSMSCAYVESWLQTMDDIAKDISSW